MTKVQVLIALIQKLIDGKFTGSIEIHFSQGGIGKTIKHETIN